jgi:hypothetical protein
MVSRTRAFPTASRITPVCPSPSVSVADLRPPAWGANVSVMAGAARSEACGAAVGDQEVRAGLRQGQGPGARPAAVRHHPGERCARRSFFGVPQIGLFELGCQDGAVEVDDAGVSGALRAAAVWSRGLETHIPEALTVAGGAIARGAVGALLASGAAGQEPHVDGRWPAFGTRLLGESIAEVTIFAAAGDKAKRQNCAGQSLGSAATYNLIPHLDDSRE